MNPISPSSDPISITNGLIRRNFMKKSVLTAGAITALGRGISFAAGEGGSGISGHVVKYKYQLKCKKSPEVDDGVIAWSEATSAQVQPSSKQTRLDCSGPNQDETSSSALTVIKATISSSLLIGVSTSTSIPKLGIPKDNPPPGAKVKDQ